MRNKLLIILAASLLLILAACGGSEETFPPEDVNEGIDRCEVCNMLVPNDHNATQLLLNDGRSLKFDDIGCMVEWVNENGLENVNVRYVRDYNNSGWIEMETATFVYDYNFRTPMAYGIYSFASMEAAEAFIAEEGGTLLTFEELSNHSWERNMELMKMMKEKHKHGGGMSKQSDTNKMVEQAEIDTHNTDQSMQDQKENDHN